MGRRQADKGKDKGGGDNKDDDPSKTPEPYNCTGNLEVDFTELCRRANMTEIPAIVTRPKPPGLQPVVETTKAAKKGTKQTGAEASAAAAAASVAVDEVDTGSSGENLAEAFVPTTYIMRPNYDYMRPVVQVDVDPGDKKASVKEVYVRNWKIDLTMMEIFRQALPAVEKLHMLTLCNVGLNDATLEILGNFVQECANLKTLVVEGSPVKGEEWHRLIVGESNKVWNLSLRNNRITDLGARYLGYALGTPRHQNQTLVKLNLAFNNITGEGVKDLAAGLRMNRCLLVLDLSSNKIGDDGARHLADVMSTFKLTHEEVVERRVRMRDQLSPDRSGKSPPSSRKTDRPTSKGAGVPDKKAAATGGKGGAAGGTGSKGGKSGKDAPADKKDDKKQAKTTTAQDAANANTARGKKTSNPPPVQVDTKSTASKQQRTGKTTPKGTRGFSHGENENPENYEQKHPLDEEVIYEDGDLWVKIGNRSIISINLNRNSITEKGAYELLRAMKYQTRVHNQGPKNAPIGLMRITLANNLVDEDHSYMRHLNAIMDERDVTNKNKSSNSATERAPGSASTQAPGTAAAATALAAGTQVPATGEKIQNVPESASISSATTRVGSSVGQSRASSKTTLGGRADSKGK